MQQAKLELKLERQNKFATNQQQAEDNADNDSTEETAATKEPKKRGAPAGHPGWFRPTPTHYDWAVDVPASCRCPHCQGHVIGIRYRKVPRTIEELFGITFTPAALSGFETALAELAEPVVDDIAKKLASSDGPVNADETYWTTDGARSFFWVHGDEKFIHFQYDTSRAGQVPRDILGDDFCGTLVTDCYAGYAASAAGAKQKCLAHLARRARDWQKLTKADSADFEDIKQFVTRCCRFHRRRREKKLSRNKQAAETAWLLGELSRLDTCDMSHEKAITLPARLLRHPGEWLVFLDNARVPPTNNLTQRYLRPLVVLRKITFGSRSDAGATRMAKLMIVGETARCHGHRARQIYFELYTRPPTRVLRRLYAGGKQAAA